MCVPVCMYRHASTSEGCSQNEYGLNIGLNIEIWKTLVLIRIGKDLVHTHLREMDLTFFVLVRSCILHAHMHACSTANRAERA